MKGSAIFTRTARRTRSSAETRRSSGSRMNAAWHAHDGENLWSRRTRRLDLGRVAEHRAAGLCVTTWRRCALPVHRRQKRWTISSSSLSTPYRRSVRGTDPRSPRRDSSLRPREGATRARNARRRRGRGRGGRGDASKGRRRGERARHQPVRAARNGRGTGNAVAAMRTGSHRRDEGGDPSARLASRQTQIVHRCFCHLFGDMCG